MANGLTNTQGSDEKLEMAKELINEYCYKEFGGPVDFDDLEHISITYTTVTDDEIPIQIYIDLVHFRLERYLENYLLERIQYESLDALIANELEFLDFDLLISVDDDDLERFAAWEAE